MLQLQLASLHMPSWLSDEESCVWVKRDRVLPRPFTATTVLRKEEEVGDEKKSYSKLSKWDEDESEQYMSLSSFSSSSSFGTNILASPDKTSFSVFSVFVSDIMALSYSPFTIRLEVSLISLAGCDMVQFCADADFTNVQAWCEEMDAERILLR